MAEPPSAATLLDACKASTDPRCCSMSTDCPDAARGLRSRCPALIHDGSTACKPATPPLLGGCPPLAHRVSRERLPRAAHALSVRHTVPINSRSIASRGPAGETLARDWVCFGARRPRHVLANVVPSLKFAPDTALVIQHANNPYGFAWHRRVDEDNVDSNRSFRERFDPQQCPADYDALFDCLNPVDLDLDPIREAGRWTRIDAFVAEYGLHRFQQAAEEGQYRRPRGLQFGGHAPAAGTRQSLALVREPPRDARRQLARTVRRSS